MSELEAIRRSAELTAAACAEVLGQLLSAPGSHGAVDVQDGGASPWEALPFPLVSVRVEFIAGINGQYVFALAPEQARRLAAGMMGVEPEGAGELSEMELSAVSEAMNQMMGRVATAMADAIGVPTDIAAPVTEVLADRDAAEALGEPRYTARFAISAGELEAEIVQVVPAEFAAVLAGSFGESGDAPVEAVDDADPVVAEPAADEPADDARGAVERIAGITASASADVLTALIGDRVTATTPEVDAGTDDPLGELTYPLVTVEVAYVAGVTGSNLFVLAPAQAATLAAVMMGLDEPSGDGLSELELSAVSEAMNQMMGAATNVLAATLGMALEVAPPVCDVVDSADDARARFAEPAYSARFRIAAERLDADIVQLVPADFARALQAAFGAAEEGLAPGTAAPLAPAATASMNAAAARSVPGALEFDHLRAVQVRVSAELGRARVPVSDVMNLPPGAIVELDRTPAEPIDILVNGRAFARARLVLVDGEYAAQIVSLEPPTLLAG